MKDVEVEVISKEIIKPSSPTPDHLRHYQFSYLDQISPAVYGSLVHFYELNDKTQPNNDITEISNHLKKSLAQVLTLFYPLAGRVDIDKDFVDCNDEGVPYVEAQVKCRLCDVLNNPIPGEINKFLPFELDSHITNNNKFVLGIQLNIFECGAFAIGQCISHKVADALSMIMFTKTWAAIARGDNEANIVRPEFISATLFPPKESTGLIDAAAGITRNRVTKRFVFDRHMIEILRTKYKGRPSRVEALSTFIWSRFVAATKDDTRSPYENSKAYSYKVIMMHAVNLRPRFDPPLPQCCFGNLSRLAITAPDQDCCGGQLHVPLQVREGINKIDNEYMRRLQEGDHDDQYSLVNKFADGFTKGDQMAAFGFTSLCRFPLYDNDFGWGRPTWVGTPSRMFHNLAIFIDTKEGDGIEAYISLTEEVMAKFESDTELLASVSSSSARSINN